MMQTKILEIRDQGTVIPVLAIDMRAANEPQRWYFHRCGYNGVAPNIAITHLAASGSPFWNDPCGWGGRTYPVAHNYIIELWDDLSDGDVIDVEFILGETEAPKLSERFVGEKS